MKRIVDGRSRNKMIQEYQIPDELLARCAGQEAICRTVLEKFIEQMQADLPQLTEAVGRGETETAARLAHRIKGASANIAASELRAAAAKLESAASTQETDTVRAMLSELQSEWQQFQVLIENYLHS